MNNRELERQCEEFRRTLDGARGEDPLDDDSVRRFNGFVAKHPHVLEWKNEYGRTLLKALFWYLVHAIQRKFPLHTFQDLVTWTPQVLSVKHRDGWTLLHYNPTAVDIVSFFVQQNPDAAKRLNRWNQAPLHLASRATASLPVIRVLVEAYPRAVQICDGNGDPPLQDACSTGAPLDVIQFLLMQRPHICLHPNNNGQLPLDRAKCQIDPHNDVIEYMTTATTAAARVLMKRLSFQGPLPQDLFEQVAAYVRSGPAAEVSVAIVALSTGEMAVLFRRGDIQAVQTGIDALQQRI